ncbi:hypothetical protein MKQ70_01170 [Chitinophaga sedimenti]|uniref:hypothetical protein n=1 Tax=Chitinophaga sedimenti TaxID=2033606 RepID=UPI002005CBEF|nr:hypothetical protein [Chitinophaga sedimenti]MCK7553684.1 hypothetical protein [Chitinophaga sedimenti]
MNSRRKFLLQSMAASAVLAVPGMLKAANPRRARKIGANDKVNLACIGIGNRGGEITGELAKTGLANIVALCDVDMGAPHTTAIMKQFPNARRFGTSAKCSIRWGKKLTRYPSGCPTFRISRLR